MMLLSETRKIMAPTMEKLANLLEFAVCFDKIKVCFGPACCSLAIGLVG